jgi:hypothetical protein
MNWEPSHPTGRAEMDTVRRSKRTPADLEAWAKRYREAVQPHLGEEEVEAAGAFERWRGGGSDAESILAPFVRLYEYFGGNGRVGQLHTSFLLAVTRDKVHAFAYRQRGSNLVIRKQLARFDRDEIAFYPEEGYGSDSLHLQVTEGGRPHAEGGRTHAIAIEDRTLGPGAGDVLAALKR